MCCQTRKRTGSCGWQRWVVFNVKCLKYKLLKETECDQFLSYMEVSKKKLQYPVVTLYLINCSAVYLFYFIFIFLSFFLSSLSTCYSSWRRCARSCWPALLNSMASCSSCGWWRLRSSSPPRTCARRWSARPASPWGEKEKGFFWAAGV